MVEGWVKIYQSKEEYQAIFIRELLENHQLHPVVLDRKDDEFMIGYAEVYVSPEEAEQAAAIIKDNES